MPGNWITIIRYGVTFLLLVITFGLFLRNGNDDDKQGYAVLLGAVIALPVILVSLSYQPPAPLSDVSAPFSIGLGQLVHWGLGGIVGAMVLGASRTSIFGPRTANRIAIAIVTGGCSIAAYFLFFSSYSDDIFFFTAGFMAGAIAIHLVDGFNWD